MTTNSASRVEAVAEHTPGPWTVWRGWEYAGGGEDLCIGAGEKWLANVDHREPRCAQISEDGHFEEECDICTLDSGRISAEQLANANLIAAAPDLLAACQAVLPWVATALAHRTEPHEDAVANHAEDLAALQAAIARATGATP